MSRFSRHGPPRPKPVTRITPTDWMAALEEGGALAEVARDESHVAADFAERLIRFRARVSDLTAESFPAQSGGAQLIAAAWLNIARAFAHPTTPPETRTACAPLLSEATKLADHLLALFRTHQAQASWGRQFGGDD